MQKVWNASVVDLIALLALQNNDTMTVTKTEIWDTYTVLYSEKEEL